MNLANLGKAGLLVAQNRLATAGHNINNAATAGFNRQTVLSQTAGATPTSAGWIGRGVMAVSVQRSYDNFLYMQLTGSITKGAALKTYGDQVAQVNNLFADRTVGISPNIQQFFNALEAVATAPADVAGRQELLGRANSLATQVRDANAFLDDQRKNVNTQITTTVTQVNSYLDRILDMNRQITTAQATNPGQPPNDLLDQRDQLAAELGQLVDVQVYEQDGRFNITIGNGQTVLGGDSVYHLDARPSAADPSRTVINYTVPGGGGTPLLVEMPDKYLTGGKLGGLLTFRSDVLDVSQNELGRIALGISMTINAQHMQGYDPSGAKGGYFFTNNNGVTGAQAQAVTGYANAAKAQAATGNASSPGVPIVTVTTPSQVPGQAYKVTYDAGTNEYTLVKLPEASPPVSHSFGSGSDTGSFDGVNFDFSGLSPVPNDGDSWQVQLSKNTPVVTVTDPARVPNQAYKVTYDGTNYTVSKQPEAGATGGTSTPAPGPVISFDGVDFDFTGAGAVSGDSWDVQLVSPPLAKVIGDEKNVAGAGNPVASIQDVSKLTNQDYQLKFDTASSTYSVTRIPEGTALGTIAAGDKATFDGVEIDTAGMAPGDGNTWLIQPTRAAAGELHVALSDPSKFAAAGWDKDNNAPAGSANGNNALALAQLRSAKTLGGLPGSTTGTMDLNEAYSQLVNGVAVKTQANTTAQKAQETLIQQNYSAQQAVSGVNLDEEYINVQRFQEQYRAAARLIDTASTLFDTLLALRS
ncbi:flagellar hook-associated protein FlgK [Castellaniella hirudinis]|uniref:flagellar hook-associated protein FlgK n=1 Tax=Castellaniella hirudinis TaxID=1144617 RepID=UPI0039C3A8B4